MSRRRAATARSARRAVVLMAVMIAVTMIAAAASIVLLRADALVTRTGSSLRYSQSRAAAWSGIRSAMAELADQREALLQGDSPTLTGTWTLIESKDAVGVVVRLIDLGAVGGPAEGTLVQAEGAKVNLNACNPELLGASGVVSADEAQRIGAVRGAGGLGSLADLSRDAAFTVDRIYGRILAPETQTVAGGNAEMAPAAPAGPSGSGSERDAALSSAASGEPSGAAGGGAGGAGGGAKSSALADVCTVFSADPNVQVGIAADASKYQGMPRINLGLGWTEDLVEPITERFGKDAVETTKQLLQGGTKFKSMKDVVAVFRQLNVPLRQWGSLLDAFTTSADPFVIGRVDLLRAGEEVLRTVPGIDAASAARIVAVRDRLDGGARREITWPVVEGILTQEQFELAVDSLTNRSMQWRIMVEAGRVRRGAQQGQELTDRVVLECVLDVGGPRPRVAYLREVTALQAVRSMLSSTGSKGDNAGGGDGSGDAGGGMFEVGPEGIPELGGTAEASMADAGGLQEDAGASTMNTDDAGVPGAADEGSAGGEPGSSEHSAAAETSTPGRSGPARGYDNRTGRWNPPRSQGGGRP